MPGRKPMLNGPGPLLNNTCHDKETNLHTNLDPVVFKQPHGSMFLIAR